jgi:enoyl-CoA hydratase/carnithine racemase
MTDYSLYTMLHVEIEDSVAFATIDAPPMNVMVRDLFSQLAKFGNAVAVDDNVRAVVLRSDDPDFFIAHFDVSLISTFPFETPAEKPTELGGFHLMCETYRTMPKPTIAEIAGRVGGGGNELAMSVPWRSSLAASTSMPRQPKRGACSIERFLPKNCARMSLRLPNASRVTHRLRSRPPRLRLQTPTP